MGYHLPMLQAPKHSPPSWEPNHSTPKLPRPDCCWSFSACFAKSTIRVPVPGVFPAISAQEKGGLSQWWNFWINKILSFFSRTGWGRNVFLQKHVKIQSGSVVCFHQRFNDALVIFVASDLKNQKNKSGRDMDQTPHSKHQIHKHVWGSSTRFREKQKQQSSQHQNEPLWTDITQVLKRTCSFLARWHFCYLTFRRSCRNKKNLQCNSQVYYRLLVNTHYFQFENPLLPVALPYFQFFPLSTVNCKKIVSNLYKP